MALFLAVAGPGIDWSTGRHLLAVGVAIVPSALPLGVFLYANLHYFRHGELRSYLRRVARPGWLLTWLRLWLSCLLVSFGYFWLKLCVPLVNPRRWDDALWRLDDALHPGFHPVRVLANAFRESPAAAWIDAGYALWLASVVWGIAFFAAAPGARLRRAVVFSCVLLWALGSWLYAALPAVGPVFARPGSWSEAPPAMPRARAAQDLLWSQYRNVTDSGVRGIEPAGITLGVAALPSLHVAFHALFCLWSRRFARPLFAPLVLLTGFTFVGSLVTGWHYAVDGYLGGILAIACYRLALWIEQPEPTSEASPGGS